MPEEPLRTAQVAHDEMIDSMARAARQMVVGVVESVI
jgi:hypothetical protein